MPIHDWSRIDANLFHDFRQAWTVGLRNALNGGLLPKRYSALVGRHASGVLAEMSAAQCGNRITIRHPLGRVICVIKIVSPGNKGSRSALRSFVEKTVDFLRPGVLCQDEAGRLWDVLTMLRVAAGGPSDDLVLAVAQGCATGARVVAGIRLPMARRRDMMPMWSTRTWSRRTREGRLSRNERHPDGRLASLRLVDSVMSLSALVATVTVFAASRWPQDAALLAASLGRSPATKQPAPYSG